MKNIRIISIIVIAMLMISAFAGCAAKKSTVSIGSPDDLAGLTIAVQNGTIGNDLAEEVKTKDAKTTVLGFDKYIDAITALKQSKADAIIMDGAPAEFFIKENTDLMILETPMTTEDYAIAIKKENTELVASVNSALAAMKADGSLDAILLKYLKDGATTADIDFNVGAAGGKITMGTETGFAPYEFKDGDKVIGIDVEIAAAIAKKMDKELVISDIAFDALIPSLVSGKIDFIAAGMTVTDERKQEVNFSDAYVAANQVVVIRKDSLKK